MLRQEELAFIKAIYTLQLSPGLLRELMMAVSEKKDSGAGQVPQHRA
jgi:hypothetical protein